VSDQQPDPGAAQTPPGPESEPGAEDTEVFANAEFATVPVQQPSDEPEARAAAQGPEQTREQSPPSREQGRQGSEQVQQQGQGMEEAAAPDPAPQAANTPQALIPPPLQPQQPGVPAWGGPAWAGTAYQHTSTDGGSAPKGRRGRRIAGFGITYAILAAGTAFGVIAAESPAPVDVTAVNASAYTGALAAASASASAHPAASSSAGASASASPTTAPPTTATPASTVSGRVSDGVHSGDLRYFLLPPPQGTSSVQGDPDGDKESLDDIVQEFGGGSDITSLLHQLGFKNACDRTYQDSTMGANVRTELIQFSSSSNAAQFLSGFELDGGGFQSISVPGESGAHGWSYAKDGSYRLVGVYRDGDTFYEVDVIAPQSVPSSALGSVVTAEHSRLAKG
jgi:hypothetical protein